MALESLAAASWAKLFELRDMRKTFTDLFPMFLKLAGRPCLVVGAGNSAESKIESLVRAGARVRVVAPEATPKIRAWARGRKVAWQRRGFMPKDLERMFLVIAATPSTELHERIFRLARRIGVLCNIVDVPRLCDFYYPAVVRRGALQIAISTAGQSPALAQRLRKELERQFGPEYEHWLTQIGKIRQKMQGGRLGAEERKRLLHEMVSKEGFQQYRKRTQRRSAQKLKG
jgi:precorrin-2 dehydrogenase/sirohydrochlorin ferrochelatase